MMKICDWSEVYELAGRQVGKPAVSVRNDLAYGFSEDDAIWDFIVDQMRTIYGDKTPQFYDVISSLAFGGLFFFENEEEQHCFYNVFEQPLPYSSAIFACTYSADGTIQTANT